MQRPANQARFIFITPSREYFWPDDFKRMMPLLCLVPLRGRPAIKKASQLNQVPIDLHYEWWRDDFFKREGNSFIPFFKIMNTFRPIVTYYFAVILINQFINCRRNFCQAICPCSENAIGLEHPLYFAIKLIKVVPMNSNSNSDQIHAGSVERDMFGGFHTIIHFGMG